jgi:hypothetical protein
MAGRMVNGELSETPRWDAGQPKPKPKYPTPLAHHGKGIYYWPARGPNHITNRFLPVLQSYGLRRPTILYTERMMGLPDGWLWPY